LGHRYGWVPGENDLSPRTFEDFKYAREMVAQRRSVTEMEVLHGVLKRPFMQDKSFFYESEESWSRHKVATVTERAMDPEGSPEEARQLDLKRRVKDYVTHPVVSYDSPESLGRLVEQHFQEYLGQLFPAESQPDAHEKVTLGHLAFGATFAKVRMSLGTIVMAPISFTPSLNSRSVVVGSKPERSAISVSMIRSTRDAGSTSFRAKGVGDIRFPIRTNS
jgi:hypothetical protein